MLTSALWFFCALLSKESSITFLAVMPLVIYYFADKKDAKSYMPVGLALLVTVLFMAIRTKVLGGATVSLNASVIDNMLMAAHNKLEQLTTAVYLLGLYLKTMVIPYPLSFDRSFPDLNIVTMTDLRFIVSALVLLGMLALAIVSFRKKDILSFAMFFFFITASVSSNIFVLIGTHWGERLMYTPVFAFCLVVAVLLQRYVGGAGKTASAKNAIAVIVVITIAFGGMTLARNPVWKNNSSLYLSGLSSAPNSARVQYYMGNNMIKEDQLAGKTKEQQDSIVYAGIDYLKTAVKLYPPFTDAWNQMGVAYYRLKVIDQALVCYRKGVSLNPNDATLQSNLGTALYAQAKYPEALQAFQSAVAINPNYVEAWSNIGSTYGLMGNYDAAIPAFEKAIAINPNYAQAYFFLGITWQNKGNVMLANQYLEKAYALEPSLRR
jgi:Tfp pilus assembly protein PilF